MPHYAPASAGGLLGRTTAAKESGSRKESSVSPSRTSSGAMDFIKHQINKEKEKRKSLTEESMKPRSAKLEISMESPPLVSYGTPEHSTGALLSGQLKLHVTDQPVRLEKFELELVAKLKYAKPVSKDCSDCQVNAKELKKWKIISDPKAFEKGTHSTPFSYLLEGHLPATTHNSLGSMDYVLTAVAVSTSQEKMKISHALDLKRSIFPPEMDRSAIRLFPPTNLRVEVAYPPVIHPIGEFKVMLSLNGIVSKEKELVRRWRLRRLLWRLEECSKMVSKPCVKHVQKVGGEGKGIEHLDTRTIGFGELKEGWKSDFALEGGGNTMIEFPCSINLNAKPVCDVSHPTSFAVQHRITLELIVVEEVLSSKSTTSWNATSSARVLRMAFTVFVTERQGQGISWDEEQPPLYDEVPESPPGYSYSNIEDYDAGELGELSPLPVSNPFQQGESSNSQPP
ncbi:MAG: hypothetical protein LQ340_005219 [Diploschistes diacapsis]|nr:MAG: hypothetical protein LQ340_005219 [Diploschistes diacapsis]